MPVEHGSRGQPITKEGRTHYSARAAEDIVSSQAEQERAENPGFFRRLVHRNWRAQLEPSEKRSIEPQDHHMGG